MGIIELVLTGIGLAMDAFAVATCKGLASKKATWTNAIIIGLWFGIFQALMPLVGFFVGSTFSAYIESIDHWVAFALLAFIGLKMIYDAFKGGEENSNASLAFKVMLVMAIATSIDALAVGISFSFLQVNIWLAIAIIGVITFTLSMIGYKIGNLLGSKFEKWAELAGGIILVLLGLKIMLEHIGVIAF